MVSSSFTVISPGQLGQRTNYVLRFNFEDSTITFTKVKKRATSDKTYACSSFVKLEKGTQDGRCLNVTIGTEKAKTKVLNFESQEKRDVFCNLIHAVIVCGPMAFQIFKSLDKNESGKLSKRDLQQALSKIRGEKAIGRRKPSLSPNGTHETSSKPLLDISDFLMAYSQAVTTRHTQESLDGDTTRPRTVSGFVSKIANHRASTDQGDSTELELLNGEQVMVRQEHTSRIHNTRASRGTLQLTTYRIHYVGYRSGVRPEIVDLPLGSLSRVERGNDVQITFYCKDCYELTFGFDASGSWVQGFAETVQRQAFSGSQATVFAFTHHLETDVEGWNVYDPAREYERLGLLDSDFFRLCHANIMYTLSSTYPRLFILPSSFPDSDLASVCSFRSKGRIPVVVWKHPITDATLARCAQPLSGVHVTGKRCLEDERLVEALRKASPSKPPHIYLIDARPFKAAVGNSVMGKGYENTANYDNAIIKFMKIENIHSIRNAYEKLMDLCNSESWDDSTTGDSSWASQIEQTRWLYFIRLILKSSIEVAGILSTSGSSCIVHCSDGWDRTPQLTSLVQLILDPFYRTINGFIVLLEKEWLSFGHKFAERFGHADDKYDNEQRSPIFIQFLDCVYQMIRQYPLSFEFNEKFLLLLADHVTSCRFGTFLFECEAERSKNLLSFHTTSLWSYIRSQEVISRVKNALYRENKSYVIPNYSPKKIVLWENNFLRHDMRALQKEDSEKAQSELSSRYKKLMKLALESGVLKGKLDKSDLEAFGFIERRDSISASESQSDGKIDASPYLEVDDGDNCAEVSVSMSSTQRNQSSITSSPNSRPIPPGIPPRAKSYPAHQHPPSKKLQVRTKTDARTTRTRDRANGKDFLSEEKKISEHSPRSAPGGRSPIADTDVNSLENLIDASEEEPLLLNVSHSQSISPEIQPKRFTPKKQFSKTLPGRIHARPANLSVVGGDEREQPSPISNQPSHNGTTLPGTSPSSNSQKKIPERSRPKLKLSARPITSRSTVSSPKSSSEAPISPISPLASASQNPRLRSSGPPVHKIQASPIRGITPRPQTPHAQKTSERPSVPPTSPAFKTKQRKLLTFHSHGISGSSSRRRITDLKRSHTYNVPASHTTSAKPPTTYPSPSRYKQNNGPSTQPPFNSSNSSKTSTTSTPRKSPPRYHRRRSAPSASIAKDFNSKKISDLPPLPKGPPPKLPLKQQHSSGGESRINIPPPPQIPAPTRQAQEKFPPPPT